MNHNHGLKFNYQGAKITYAQLFESRMRLISFPQDIEHSYSYAFIMESAVPTDGPANLWIERTTK